MQTHRLNLREIHFVHVIVVISINTVVVNSHNKAFKSDSQRMAFFIPSLSSVFTMVWLVFVVALLTP